MTNNWINEENLRAKDLTKTGKTTNNNAPRLVKDIKKTNPTRYIKSIYIQESHIKLFDKLVFEQKMIKGKKSTELMEEAIELLIKIYDK